MKKKIILLCLYLIPFLGFTNENLNNENTQIANQEQKNIDETENTKNDEIALNFPNKNELIEKLTDIQTSNSSSNNTFPIKTSIGYSLDNDDTDYFLQAKGTDFLNNSKTRNISFLIKIPYYQITQASNKIGILPDKFNLNFTDPLLTISLGDNKYNLSSLTIKDLEKRGGFLEINYKNIIGVSSIYLLSKPSKDKNPSDNIGASFFIKPFSFMKVSSNFLFTKFEKEKYSIPINNYTYSVKSIFYLNEKNKIDIEAATTNKLDHKHLGYFAYLDGKNKHFSYLINGFFANPYFIGSYTDKKNNNNYSDKTKLDGFIKYELNNFSAKFSHIFENKNFNKLNSKDNATRLSSFEFDLSSKIKTIDTSLALKNKESKNLLNHDGYKLNAINLNVVIPINIWDIENSIELGKYNSRIENYFSRNWLGYKFRIKTSPRENTTFNIYTKLGNILYDDIFTVSYLAGLDFKIKTTKNLDLSFIYEYSINTRKPSFVLKNKRPIWKNNYLKQNLSYTFSNKHNITLTAQLNKQLEEKKEKSIFLTYTIPLEIPTINRFFR